MPIEPDLARTPCPTCSRVALRSIRVDAYWCDACGRDLCAVDLQCPRFVQSGQRCSRYAHIDDACRFAEDDAFFFAASDAPIPSSIFRDREAGSMGEALAYWLCYNPGGPRLAPSIARRQFGGERDEFERALLGARKRALGTP